ncbi:MAG: glutamate-5-semialdehyde dehydrogenase [Fimbriimonadaceae bacterium]
MSQTVPVSASLKAAREASRVMATLTTVQKNQALSAFADLLEEHAENLVAANAQDLREQEGKIDNALYQRLKLDNAKLRQLVAGIRSLVNLQDPVGELLMKTKLDDGLILEKRAVPLGVIGIIFESRPDVMPQILSLILKSGNAVVFKGGREAANSNRAFMELLPQVRDRCPWLPEGWAHLLFTREEAQEMLGYPEYVDLVIPRGSNALVQQVMEKTRIPVLGHADGVCHLFVHQSADISKAVRVVVDAKVNYPSACNALETLLVQDAVAERFLGAFAKSAQEAGIEFIADSASAAYLPGAKPAKEEDWSTEYGDLRLSIKVVADIEEAIAHINRYGSHHTDGIVATDECSINRFIDAVDSASVIANASTRFADGFRYGLGAEIGISTARTHARGPVGLEGLVTYKYLLRGEGQIAADYIGEPPASTFKHERLS